MQYEGYTSTDMSCACDISKYQLLYKINKVSYSNSGYVEL